MRPEVELYIQGQRFLVRSDETREHLIEVARFVDGRLSDVTGGRHAASFPHAVLACMNVASELFKLRDEAETLRQAVGQEAQAIVDRVDRALRELGGDGE